ncbi:hypothetical protein [Chelativorans sp. YIM 93263]|uniref:hypothetical protein n=1 Tax=Chelativorans sp. YIM 93263 TaxID=2906648 RepID=UPI002378A34F|nr:hypothetical protein [Chelativorans sp. YIM 93263]
MRAPDVPGYCSLFGFVQRSALNFMPQADGVIGNYFGGIATPPDLPVPIPRLAKALFCRRNVNDKGPGEN